MWSDDINFPSGEEHNDGFELPEHDLEWLQWWQDATFTSSEWRLLEPLRLNTQGRTQVRESSEAA